MIVLSLALLAGGIQGIQPGVAPHIIFPTDDEIDAFRRNPKDGEPLCCEARALLKCMAGYHSSYRAANRFATTLCAIHARKRKMPVLARQKLFTDLRLFLGLINEADLAQQQ